MLKRLYNSFKDSFISVAPITILILVVAYLIGCSSKVIISFSISALLLIIGITLFTFGADLSMVMIGEKIGNSLIKRKKLFSVLAITLVIGFVITIAEPDLMVLASQLTSIPNVLIITLVALGVGLFLMLSLFRIIKGIKINTILSISYIIIFILMLFSSPSFITVAFDSGGVTTGPMSVPFIVALGYGFTKLRNDKQARNDTFGLVGIASIGPIIVVLLLGILFHPASSYDTSSFFSNGSLLIEYLDSFYHNFVEATISLVPILVVFIIFELLENTLNNYDMRKIVLGLCSSLVGLTVFLTGVEVGFIKMGYEIGNLFASHNMPILLIILGMVVGYLIVKAEPAVKVLNEQISDLTEGSISKKMIGLCLSIGVSLAVGLSLIRLFLKIPITYFLVPGYILSIILAYKTQDIFTAVAFDSGGAASGPLTTSFLLPIAIGACMANGGDIMTMAFGVVSLVSLSPLITIQLLGSVYECRINKQTLAKVKDLDESILDYEVSL